MKERIARPVGALVIGGLIVLLGAVGWRRAAPPSSDMTALPAAPELAALQVADSVRGRAVFEKQGCGGCHSAAGAGSGRIPLNGVGSRRSRAELRAWTIGDASVASSLAPATLRRKQGYAQLPTADLDALVAFLASLGR